MRPARLCKKNLGALSVKEIEDQPPPRAQVIAEFLLTLEITIYML